MQLTNYTSAAIAAIQDLHEAKELHDEINGLAEWAARQKKSLNAQNEIAQYRIRIEHRMGELIGQMETSKGGAGTHKANSSRGETSKINQLESLDIKKPTAHRYETLSRQPISDIEERMAKLIELEKEITTRSVMAPNDPLAQPAGDHEWYTPPSYIEAARKVMGGIDLDPASCEMAQERVKAKKYFTIEDDGLEQIWEGRVWLNPPYSRGIIDAWCAKTAKEVAGGEIGAMCMLVNSATDTEWFHLLLSVFPMMCLLRGRENFMRLDGNETKPTQGQIMFYGGPDPEVFGNVFGDMGKCLLTNLEGEYQW